MNPPQALPDPGRINFRLLHYFRVVAEEMNFTQAARRLNMSQPPLSKHIKDLESQLGVVLFKRTTRSMTLTPAGRTLLRNVERLLDQADSALHQVQQMGRGEGGHMVVGMVGTSAWGGLIAALRRFSERSARRLRGGQPRRRQSAGPAPTATALPSGLTFQGAVTRRLLP